MATKRSTLIARAESSGKQYGKAAGQDKGYRKLFRQWVEEDPEASLREIREGLTEVATGDLGKSGEWQDRVLPQLFVLAEKMPEGPEEGLDALEDAWDGGFRKGLLEGLKKGGFYARAHTYFEEY